MARSDLNLAALAVAFLASGCAVATGTGIGFSGDGETAATFAWSSDDGVHGQMTALLADGSYYDGPFFQITRETTFEETAPLWRGWEGHGGWRGWPEEDAQARIAITYTGTVLANLKAASGARMRCRFALARPRVGMSGGGFGRCQLSDGAVINADFDARHD